MILNLKLLRNKFSNLQLSYLFIYTEVVYLKKTLIAYSHKVLSKLLRSHLVKDLVSHKIIVFTQYILCISTHSDTAKHLFTRFLGTQQYFLHFNLCLIRLRIKILCNKEIFISCNKKGIDQSNKISKHFFRLRRYCLLLKLIILIFYGRFFLSNLLFYFLNIFSRIINM